MMAILPVSISWVGKPDTEEEKQPLVLQSIAVAPQKMGNPTDTERRANENEDIVELLD
jgi:hypothetical protein